MALYVCFNDSLNDPTYESLDSAFIVDGPSDSDNNPCNHFHHLEHAPVCPINAREAAAFARLMGWEVVITNGVVTFRTSIAAPAEPAPRVDASYSC